MALSEQQVTTDFSAVTEAPGSRATSAQLSMLKTRYVTASEYCAEKDVLEVGCGAGLGLGYLARRARRVVGGDCTASLIQLAQHYYRGRVSLLRLDAQALPFKDHSFDVVILYEAIYYLADPEIFLGECRRLLRDDGVLLLCSANRDCPEFVGSRFSVRYYSAPELSDVLQQSGFEVQLYGAFSLDAKSPKERLVSTMRQVASASNLIPGTLKGREFLKRVFYGKLSVLGGEIDDDMSTVRSLAPISSTSPDRQHKVLYSVARPGARER